MHSLENEFGLWDAEVSRDIDMFILSRLMGNRALNQMYLERREI